MRNVIVHCHMFKNAGSSLDWSLQRNFGVDFVDHREDQDMRTGQEYMEKYILENKNIKALSSHHVKMPLPNIANINVLPIFIFRNPIERAGSVYEFEKKQQSDTPGAMNAKKLSFSDYVKWRMEKNSGATIRNFQTRYCTGKITKPGLDLTNDDYKEAKKVVSENQLIGLVEHYNSSMIWFEEVMASRFTSFDLSYVRQNVNQSVSATTDEKIDKIFSKLDSEASELLIEQNKYDILLYNYVRSIFSKRIARIENLEEKLDNFNSRCLSIVSNC